ncbi:hypothetical protein N665_7669s0001 [Sinapis alba]|nr:hypothetical protein N665_7669s0001 [Sinapis alba]
MDNRDLAPGSSSEMTKNDSVNGMEKEKEALNALAKSFVRGGVNPNTIKSPSFAKFIRLLNPNFGPTVSQLEKEVLEIHRECKEKAKEFLKGFQGKLTLSYEWMVLGHGWTRDYVKGPVLHEGFVCITAHFVDCWFYVLVFNSDVIQIADVVFICAELDLCLMMCRNLRTPRYTSSQDQRDLGTSR